MFLCHPLLEVLAGRGIEDIDAFLQAPSWSDLPDPFSISSMEPVVGRILAAVGRKERIVVFGDYDCDGVLGAHILRGVLKSLGAEARVYLPHRDEGYGLNGPAVHQFSLSGTDLLITVDNGINARAAVRLAQRLGIEVIVIDHHRVQDRAETLSVWSDRFCGTGLATMVAWALTQRAGWRDSGVERLVERASHYAAIASIADCVPLLGSTRTLARLGLASLGKSNHCGVRELLKACCKDPLRPNSHEIAFGIAPRINAAGRVAHPAAALAVLDAGADELAAEKCVQRLNELNVERRRLVELHFEQLALEMDKTNPAGLVVYRKSSPKGIAGLLASRCVEQFGVPSIVLTPAMDPGLAVGSGRTVPGIDLIEELRPFGHLFSRFGGHAQAIGLTMPLENISEFQEGFTRALEPRRAKTRINLRGEAELSLSLVGRRFYDQLLLLEPFGEGNRAPLFSVSGAEVVSVKNRWVRIRQGKNMLEVLCWELPVSEKMYGDFLVEFYGQTRVLRGYSKKQGDSARV